MFLTSDDSSKKESQIFSLLVQSVAIEGHQHHLQNRSFSRNKVMRNIFRLANKSSVRLGYSDKKKLRRAVKLLGTETGSVMILGLALGLDDQTQILAGALMLHSELESHSIFFNDPKIISLYQTDFAKLVLGDTQSSQKNTSHSYAGSIQVDAAELTQEPLGERTAQTILTSTSMMADTEDGKAWSKQEKREMVTRFWGIVIIFGVFLSVVLILN